MRVLFDIEVLRDPAPVPSPTYPFFWYVRTAVFGLGLRITIQYMRPAFKKIPLSRVGQTHHDQVDQYRKKMGSKYKDEVLYNTCGALKVIL